MPEAIDGSGSEQPVIRESLVPFGEIQIAGHDGGGAFVAFGDQVMQIFILRRSQGFEPKIIDDEERHASEGCELAFVGAGGAGSVEGTDQLSATGEHDIDAAADGAVPERLGEMTFADTDVTDDEHGSMFGEVAVGGQIVNERAVELRESIEVELLEGLLGAKGSTAQAGSELLLFAARDLVLDEQGEKVGVRELQIDRFTIAGLERIENAGEAQLLE